MENLPKKIKVIFEDNPELSQLIPRPLLINDTQFGTYALQSLFKQLKDVNQTEIYKIVYENDEPKNLMKFKDGSLKGLSSTVITENGKIKGQAGLKKIELDPSGIICTIINLSIYSALKTQLDFITNITTEIRNHQILEENSKFARITNTIIDSIDCIPELSTDPSLRSIYFDRVLRNNDDCYELYVIYLEKFKQLEQSKPNYHQCGVRENVSVQSSNSHQTFQPSSFFEHDLLRHPIFSIFEKIVAGKVCEILVNGNLAIETIERHEKFLKKIIIEIKRVLERRLSNFKSWIIDTEQDLEQNLSLNGYQKKDISDHINQSSSWLDTINSKIEHLLDQKLKSLEMFKSLVTSDKIELYLINGMLLINDEKTKNDNQALQSIDAS